MFEKIVNDGYTNADFPHFSLQDTCFSQNFIVQEPNLDHFTFVTSDRMVETIIQAYQRKNLHVSRNLFLYYLWITKEMYGNYRADLFKLTIDEHATALDLHVPSLQFSKKYKSLLVQYFKQAGHNIS